MPSSPGGKLAAYQAMLDRSPWMKAIDAAHRGANFARFSGCLLERNYLKELFAQRRKLGLIFSLFVLRAWGRILFSCTTQD
jgi:hypothetical protein